MGGFQGYSYFPLLKIRKLYFKHFPLMIETIIIVAKLLLFALQTQAHCPNYCWKKKKEIKTSNVTSTLGTRVNFQQYFQFPCQICG